MYVNFAQKFSLTKTPQKEALLYLLKSFKTTKYFIILLQCILQQVIYECHPNYSSMQFKLNAAEQ
jgi:hypothetical protein